MSKVVVRIGRSGEGAEAIYSDPDETVAVVKSFHTPPRFVVFTRPAKGMQWLKDSDFTSYGAAERRAKLLMGTRLIIGRGRER